MVSENFAEILLSALSLLEADRAMLADHLRESLTPPNQKEIKGKLDLLKFRICWEPWR